LKNNVQLRIDENVLLLGGEQLTDYPEIETRFAGTFKNAGFWTAQLLYSKYTTVQLFFFLLAPFAVIGQKQME
jgi:hypothetical protein